MKKSIENSFRHHVTIVSKPKHFNIHMIRQYLSIMQSATKIICFGNGRGKVLLRVCFYRILLLITQMKSFHYFFTKYCDKQQNINI